MSMEPTGSPFESSSAAESATPVPAPDLTPDFTSDLTPDPAPDAAFDLTMAVSQLASNSTDLRIMLKLLVSQLADALGDRIVVERAGRFRKTDEIKSVRINLGGDSLEAVVDGGSVRCSIGHSSGGIRIRSEQVGMDQWLTRLLTSLQAEAAHSEQTRIALENIVIGGPA